MDFCRSEGHLVKVRSQTEGSAWQRESYFFTIEAAKLAVERSVSAVHVAKDLDGNENLIRKLGREVTRVLAEAYLVMHMYTRVLKGIR